MEFSSDKLQFANALETKKIFEDFPHLRDLHINYDFNTDIHFKSTDKFVDHNDFEQWLLRLLNKLNDIRFSYVQLSYSYKKGIPDKNWKRDQKEGGTIFFEDFTTEEHEANKFLFDFFSESFYYHYFSSVDLLHKMINKFFSINTLEEPWGFNKQVLKELKKIDVELHNTFEDFYKSIKSNRKIRNDFTHNYAPNEIDLLSRQTIEENRRSITLMSPSYTTSTELLLEIQTLVKIYVPLLKAVENRLLPKNETTRN